MNTQITNLKIKVREYENELSTKFIGTIEKNDEIK